MDSADLLIEIGTEELPPKALKTLGAEFASAIVGGLETSQLHLGEHRWYATPRRLAVSIQEVDLAQEDREAERLGPAVNACFDDEGNPTAALKGFAQSCGVEPGALQRKNTDKGERMIFRSVEAGKPTAELLGPVIDRALHALPIPKRMRWGNGEVEFVRPVHWVVVLLGESVVPVRVLDMDADRYSRGHRFLSPDRIALEHPDEYESALAEAHVIADFSERRLRIRNQAQGAAMEAGGQAIVDDGLLDEVTALVEWPVAVSGKFDETFLQLPREVLIAVMQDHQRYFAIEDAEDRLLPAFITMANIESTDPELVRAGNERVIRPRFADAMFFWEEDCQQPLEAYVGELAQLTHQKQLGSVQDRSKRISAISLQIANFIGADEERVKRAGLLCKADLMTRMVFEFTELQGVMGRYYALQAGEDAEVAAAIEEQYLPRHAGDRLPESRTGIALALAEKLDLIAGIFSIGKRPTGSRDPYALRRAAIGVLRILMELELDLDLGKLLQIATTAQPPTLEAADSGLQEFFSERLRGLLTTGHDANAIEAVLAASNQHPLQDVRKLLALESFLSTDEARALCAAHKRCANILRSADLSGTGEGVREDLLNEPAEKVLCALTESVSGKVSAAMAEQDYLSALNNMARLREPLDEYFDQVMVMDQDPDIRGNRLAQLTAVDRLFGRVADLGRVSVDSTTVNSPAAGGKNEEEGRQEIDQGHGYQA